MTKIIYEPIGIVHTPFKELNNMPIQSTGGLGVKGTIEIQPNYVEGLKDLEGFSHIILLYHFHRSVVFSLSVIPFLDDEPHGVFSTRAPKRPNSIGVSIVKLLKIENSTLYIEDIDILDGTPLLDIKPYVPAIDNRKVLRLGWLDKKSDRMRSFKADDRFR